MVAFWFLCVDTVAGHPLYTPAILGSAATIGLWHAHPEIGAQLTSLDAENPSVTD